MTRRICCGGCPYGCTVSHTHCRWECLAILAGLDKRQRRRAIRRSVRRWRDPVLVQALKEARK